MLCYACSDLEFCTSLRALAQLSVSQRRSVEMHHEIFQEYTIFNTRTHIVEGIPSSMQHKGLIRSCRSGTDHPQPVIYVKVHNNGLALIGEILRGDECTGLSHDVEDRGRASLGHMLSVLDGCATVCREI